jgi:methyl CpG binding protein 2
MESQPASAKPPSPLTEGAGDAGEEASEGGNPNLVAAFKSLPRSIARQPTDSNRTPLYVDETLPPGWRRKVCQRKSGNSAGRYEVFILGPTGKRFRSRNQLRNFFNETGETGLNPDDFDFSTFGRTSLKDKGSPHSG